MSLLLDTCALLWFLSNDSKLSAAARAAIEETANVRWVSPGSLFEIALKVRERKAESGTGPLLAIWASTKVA